MRPTRHNVTMAQHRATERSLYTAVERLARALRHERQAFATTHGLTLLQVGVLEALSIRSLRVGDLSAELEVSQPTVSDAVGALAAKDLVQRVRSQQDARVVEVTLTADGATLIGQLPGSLSAGDSPRHDRGAVVEGLLHEMRALSEAGKLAANHSCFTCRFLEKDADGRRCSLLEIPLAPAALRADCPEHEEVRPRD